MLRKNVRAMITCQTPIALGITIAQRVFSSPRSWTTRYVGIRPPENSMVKISTLMITFRPKNVRRDNGYAIAIVSVTLIRVPPIA